MDSTNRRTPLRPVKISGLGVAWGLAVAVSGLTEAAAQGPCSFTWRNPVSGAFSDAGKWDPGPPPPAGRPECQGIAPRLGDMVAFRQGTYLVAVDGVQSSVVAEFDVVGIPPFDRHDLSFEIINAWTIGQLFTAGTMTVSGGGRLGVGEYFMGQEAQFVLNGGQADFSRVHPGNSPPPGQEPQFLVVGDDAVLTTSGPFGSYGIEIVGARWNHTAVAAPGTFAPTHAVFRDGALFSAAAIDLGSTSALLEAEGGSRLLIGELTGGTVRLSGGSRMENANASNLRGSGNLATEVHGPGSVWAISGALRLLQAFDEVRVAGGGLLTCGTVLMDDSGSTLEVRDAGSRLASGTIELGIARRGSLNVGAGGRVDTQALFVGGQTSGVGSAVVAGPGAALVLTVGMLIGDSGQGNLRIGAGGTVLLNSPSALGLGFAPTGQGTVLVAGTNAFLDARQSEVSVGRAGNGSLRIDESGVAFARLLSIGEFDGAVGSVQVTQSTGTQTTLQVQDTLTIGARGKGDLTISGSAVAHPDLKAKVTARSLSAGGSVQSNLVRVLGAGARLEIAEDMRIGDGGTATLTLTNGASATCRRLLVGLDPNLSTSPVAGTVQTTAPQTILTITEQLAVGQQEQGVLRVRDGSRVEVAPSLNAACEAGTTRNGVGVVAVTGANALLSAPSTAFILGREGEGALEVSKGGRVVCQSTRLATGDLSVGRAVIGNADQDALSTATWQIAGDLDIGEAGFGSLFVIDGGRVEAASASLGRTADSQGNAVAAGQSTWLLSGALVIGEGTRARACSLGVMRGAVVEVAGTRLDLGLGDDSEAYLGIALAGSMLNAPAATTRIGVQGWARCDVLEGGEWTTGPATLAVAEDATGSVYVGPGAQWRINGPLTVGAAGEGFLVVDGGGKVTATGPITISSRSRVSGTGTLTSTSLANNGTLDVGNSPGALMVAGQFSQAATAVLEMEIGGSTPGVQFDTLSVQGGATLGGRLNVRFINGFAPAAGHAFRLLSASDPLVGDFGTISVAGVAPGFQHQVRRTTDGRGLEFVALSAATPTSTEPPPTLQIEQFGSQIVVSWSASTPGYVLQECPDLKAPWTSLTTAHRYLVPSPALAGFFRVTRP